ncbi:cellulose synthase complex periplasmic endoglucanase BcsZ [Cupriavidus sp. D384]|uniref:cellulose synthase complex periplasmic endoglucanase BcsZ n=1 Tax=Cupriavidus sp. D384 TaxID=1538095 RepID=UPI000832A577|nr:cellulose synthase complex periplasmic endoglucanase BcsZ [Cupriavidus sp. D384]
MRRARAWLRRVSLRCAIACAMGSAALSATAAQCPWTDWDAFRRDTISQDGRVIDASTSQQVTVSEGQSYGLFFALVANDRATFDKLLAWTENNLAQGDLTTHLPAWIWGKRTEGEPAGTWGVIDPNPASDADLWIAYALLEAGRLWNERRYTALGTVVARRVLREETAVLPGLGRTLLPGPAGFHPAPDTWRLNPSYVPLPVMRRLAAVLGAEDGGWKTLADTSARLIVDTAPKGFSPDWVIYRKGHGFQPDAETKADGSYNAIRVYLWAGMTAARDPSRTSVLHAFRPMADYVVAHGHPPEHVDTQAGTFGPNAGNAGFSAAVAPYLAALGLVEAASAQATRVRTLGTQAPLGYYSQVLALFGLGHLDGHFRFEADGTLVPAWKSTCPATR